LTIKISSVCVQWAFPPKMTKLACTPCKCNGYLNYISVHTSSSVLLGQPNVPCKQFISSQIWTCKVVWF